MYPIRPPPMFNTSIPPFLAPNPPAHLPHSSTDQKRQSDNIARGRGRDEADIIRPLLTTTSTTTSTSTTTPSLKDRPRNRNTHQSPNPHNRITGREIRPVVLGTAQLARADGTQGEDRAGGEAEDEGESEG